MKDMRHNFDRGNHKHIAHIRSPMALMLGRRSPASPYSLCVPILPQLCALLALTILRGHCQI